ncbi:MAG: GNAT family N-acetyltransferase [Desulfobacteraceae bacterium]|nr:MAG: GNAT family N-acetyltransferase [Desulfobacteraceae bacterium]
MDMIIREAAEIDLPAVLVLYAQLGQDDGSVLSLEEAGRILDRMNNYPDYRLYVAVIKRRVVGTFAMLIMDNMAHKGARSAIIEDVVVDERLRGQGLGKKMILFAYGLCHEKGCYKMALTSNKNRKEAHRFYESLGFEQHGYSFSINSPEMISRSV